MTSCSMEFFRKVKAMCATEFMTYATCLERGSANMEFSQCRNTQVTILQSYIDHKSSRPFVIACHHICDIRKQMC